jgi:hypothetical protein
MLCAIVDFTERVAPETWCRYLGVVLEGLRRDPDAPPLAGRALDDAELDAHGLLALALSRLG